MWLPVSPVSFKLSVLRKTLSGFIKLVWIISGAETRQSNQGYIFLEKPVLETQIGNHFEWTEVLENTRHAEKA